jgi:hypothetical protein
MISEVIEKLEKINSYLSSDNHPDTWRTTKNYVQWLVQNLTIHVQNNRAIDPTLLENLIKALATFLDSYSSELNTFETRQFTGFLENLKRHRQYLEAERLIRAKYSLSQIQSLINNPNLPDEFSTFTSSISAFQEILASATRIYGVAVGRRRGKEGGEIFPVEISFHNRPRGQGGHVRPAGVRPPQFEEVIEHTQGKLSIRWESNFQFAVEIGVKAAFSFVNRFLRDMYDLPQDSRLLIFEDYDIDYTLVPDGTLDGDSIGLVVAIATIAKFTDLPTKHQMAFTGKIEALEVATIGAVGGVPLKIQAAIEKGTPYIVIPRDSYWVLAQNRELEDLCAITG